MNSTLTKSQVKVFGPRFIAGYGKGAQITAKVRYDDQCGNGHNTFSITADIMVGRRDEAGGCLHEEIARVFPNLAPFIKWHLTSSDGPMHYVANTVYHAKQHGPISGWVYFTDKANGIDRKCMKYCDLDEAKCICESDARYSIEIDAKTAKVANLDHARSSAVWPDATDEELTAPGLEARLAARLPGLMAEFQAAVESLGFQF